MAKSRTIVICCSLCFIIGFYSSLFSEEPGFRLKVRVTVANIRSAPATTSRVVAQVQKDTEFISHRKEGEWYRIDDLSELSASEKIGYIHGSVVEVSPLAVVQMGKPKKSTEIAEQVPSKGGEADAEIAWRIEKKTKTKPTEPRKDEQPSESTGDFVAFGLRAGLNRSTMSFPENGIISARTGIGVGFLMDIPMSSFLSIQPELAFSQKGAVSENYPWIAVRINYLEVPILLKMNIPVDIVRPFLIAGPSVALRLTKKDGDFKLIDFGLVFGAGGAFRLSNSGPIIFDVRYTVGLSPIIKDASGPFADIKNRVLSISLSYLFF
jgi:hypothetical protein